MLYNYTRKELKGMKKIVLKIYDKKNDRVFFKEFQTEFERDKYIRKSKYFKNLIVMKNNIDEYFLKWNGGNIYENN